jgi:hypothetical protein
MGSSGGLPSAARSPWRFLKVGYEKKRAEFHFRNDGLPALLASAPIALSVACTIEFLVSVDVIRSEQPRHRYVLRSADDLPRHFL